MFRHQPVGFVIFAFGKIIYPRKLPTQTAIQHINLADLAFGSTCKKTLLPIHGWRQAADFNAMRGFESVFASEYWRLRKIVNERKSKLIRERFVKLFTDLWAEKERFTNEHRPYVFGDMKYVVMLSESPHLSVHLEELSVDKALLAKAPDFSSKEAEDPSYLLNRLAEIYTVSSSPLFVGENSKLVLIDDPGSAEIYLTLDAIVYEATDYDHLMELLETTGLGKFRYSLNREMIDPKSAKMFTHTNYAVFKDRRRKNMEVFSELMPKAYTHFTKAHKIIPITVYEKLL